MGLQKPLPDEVNEAIAIIDDAKWWGVSPMEIMEWPIEWITKGRIVRAAQAKAQKTISERG